MPATITDLQATGIVLGMAGAIAFVFKAYQKSRQDEIDGYKEREKSLVAIAERANGHLIELAKDKMSSEGRPMVKPLVPVVPEASSPPTEKQRSTAKIATLQAELTAAELALGLPVHKEDKSKGLPDNASIAVIAETVVEIKEVVHKIAAEVTKEQDL